MHLHRQYSKECPYQKPEQQFGKVYRKGDEVLTMHLNKKEWPHYWEGVPLERVKFLLVQKNP
jgi:hypothetical protein